MLAFGYAFLYVPILPADHLLVQRIAAGHGVGRLLDQVVRRAAAQPADARAAWLSLRIAALQRHAARWCSARWPAGAGPLRPVPGPHAVRRHDHRAAGDARSDHRAVAAAAVRLAANSSIGWPAGRGMTTITIAHITFTMAYVAVVVQSRLASLDDSLEEAAMDLGARPAKVFFVITLPIISPALVSGWLLAFTLSLDDLVIASFVSGPGVHDAADGDLLQRAAWREPDINALATIIVALVTTGIIIAGVFMARQEKIRKIDEQMAASSRHLNFSLFLYPGRFGAVSLHACHAWPPRRPCAGGCRLVPKRISSSSGETTEEAYREFPRFSWSYPSRLRRPDPLLPAGVSHFGCPGTAPSGPAPSIKRQRPPFVFPSFRFFRKLRVLPEADYVRSERLPSQRPGG